MLLPNPHDSFKLEWVDPHKVICQNSSVDYEVDVVEHKQIRIYHINFLKKWHVSGAAMMATESNQGFI